MKVLKTADTSKWSYKFTCPQCESLLEAERGDVKYEHHDGCIRDPDYDTWTVSCPICQRSQNIPEKDIPKALQVQIKNKQFANPGVSYTVSSSDDLSDNKQNPWTKG